VSVGGGVCRENTMVSCEGELEACVALSSVISLSLS
jgi:hypothetical protein